MIGYAYFLSQQKIIYYTQCHVLNKHTKCLIPPTIARINIKLAAQEGQSDDCTINHNATGGKKRDN